MKMRCRQTDQDVDAVAADGRCGLVPRVWSSLIMVGVSQIRWLVGRVKVRRKNTGGFLCTCVCGCVYVRGTGKWERGRRKLSHCRYAVYPEKQSKQRRSLEGDCDQALLAGRLPATGFSAMFAETMDCRIEVLRHIYAYRYVCCQRAIVIGNESSREKTGWGAKAGDQ
jgi:hypothetical protein